MPSCSAPENFAKSFVHYLQMDILRMEIGNVYVGIEKTEEML